MHSGTLSGLPPVDECRGDSKLNEFWGVDSPSTVDVQGQKIERPILYFEYGGDQYEIHRHPALFISEDIKTWYSSFVASEFSQMESYKEQTPLWMDCYHLYNRYLNKFKEVELKNGK